MKRIKSNSLSLLFLTTSSLLIQACNKSPQSSAAETKVLQSVAFTNNFNVHDVVGDVHSTNDSIPASRPFHVNQISEAIEVPVRDCTTPGLYEMEKQMALNEAKQDLTGATVPVKFSYSFGKKHDVLAKYANKRAVLSSSNGGISYIPVGSKTGSNYNGKSFYYQADNTEVARQYKTGERCFFSTLKIDPNHFTRASGYYDFISVNQGDIAPMANELKSKNTTADKLNYLKHMIHYMYYGYCAVGQCAANQAFAGEYANRLFREVPSLVNGEPQIIKLYIADLRSEQMAYDIVKLSEDTTRGMEIDSSIKNILNICEVHKNYHDVTKNLSLAKEVNGYNFDAIDGAVQLVNNILSHDVDGTMLSSQYTPIVIDLDGDGVQTSSTRWGTYFNMAALANTGTGINNGQAHRTAWLGGDYVDHNLSIADSRVNLDVRIDSKDAFLVVPNDQGQVTSSTQMFGDKMIVGGKSYANGFLALQAFTGKDCQSQDVTKRYVGPWDGDIYENKLKIWLDQNRNGVSDANEIKSLRESGLAAINACHIVHQSESDRFGNGTNLRSAVLMQGPYTNLLQSPEEIIYHLQNGEGYDGEKSYFNLAIDLIFKVNEDDRCPSGAMTASNYPSLTPILPVEGPIGIPTTEPVPIIPPATPPLPPAPLDL